MANSERRRLFVGARARIIARGQRVGWATGASGSRLYQKVPVEVVDNIEVEEYATLGYTVSLRMDVVGLVAASMVSAGLIPEVGQSSEEHLRNIILLEPFTVQVLDNQTNKPQYEFQDCEISEEGFNIQARSLMMLNIVLVGIRVADSAET